MAPTSDAKLLRDLGKLLSSSSFQPNAIHAAGSSDPAPLVAHRSGCAAVDDCVEAYNEAFRTTKEKTNSDYDARRAAVDAYRQAMPALSGSRNIADFIACVAHGLVLGAIQGNDASRLIYAAQVAHTAIPVPCWAPEPRRRGRPHSSGTGEPSFTYPTTGEPWHWSEDLKRHNQQRPNHHSKPNPR